MKRSTDRILTTFVGSLARPADLIALMKAKETGQPYDLEALAARVRSAVAEAVRHQAATGVDIVTDGEQGKASFITYVGERLTGFEPRAIAPARAMGGIARRSPSLNTMSGMPAVDRGMSRRRSVWCVPGPSPTRDSRRCRRTSPTSNPPCRG